MKPNQIESQTKVVTDGDESKKNRNENLASQSNKKIRRVRKILDPSGDGGKSTDGDEANSK